MGERARGRWERGRRYEVETGVHVWEWWSVGARDAAGNVPL